MADPLEVHNAHAGRIAADLVTTAWRPRGDVVDILVLAESVLVGVCLACVKLGGDDKVLDVIVDRARQRIAEIRLKDLETEGSA